MRSSRGIGDAPMWRDDASWTKRDEVDHLLLTVRGGLSLRTATALRRVLDKLLLDRGRVVVDLSDAELLWQPAVDVFPTVFASAGGWPLARMVLARPNATMASALRSARVPLNVPLAESLDEAGRALDERPPRVARTYDVPSAAAAGTWVRSLVASLCEDCLLSDALSGAAATVATELITNAVTHACAPIHLTLALDRRGLHVAVRDRAPTSVETFARPGQAGYRGYGLMVVDSLCRRWGVTPHADGKSVWGLLDVGPRSRF
jgi:anti-sigma regulatory factor (Ser/Thr protein kinase)